MKYKKIILFLIFLILILLVNLLLKKYELFTSKLNNFPKIIHQTFKTVNLIPEYEACSNSCKKMNPDWEHKLWSDDMMYDFVKKYFPQYYDNWNSFNKKIKKIDCVRYMWLYKYGGMYIDLDMECFINFNSLIEKYKNYDIILYCHGTENKEICNNGLMISKPNNKFWLEMIEYGLKNKDKDVLSCTGPPALGKLGFKHSKKYNIKLLDHYYDKIIQNNGDAAKFNCHITNEELKKEKEIKYKDWKNKGYHIGNFHGTPKDIHWLNASHFTNYKY